MNEIRNITTSDWCRVFDVKELPKACRNVLLEKDFRYRRFTEQERDMVLMKYLKKMDLEKLSVAGEDETARWEKGWGENLDNFRKSLDKKELIPHYNRKGSPARLFGNFIKPVDGNFENDWIDLLRAFLFETYLYDKSAVYEFGCGSAYNLLAFAEMDESKYYFGSDWVPQSSQIIKLIADELGHNMEGGVFDMFHPDSSMPVRENSVLLTFGSLEQMGTDYGKFLQFMLDKPFSLYVHIGSILEKYDTENSMVDYLTYRFEKMRNYCDGFFTSLLRLNSDGIVDILKMHRIGCGSFLSDGYSLTVWRRT